MQERLEAIWLTDRPLPLNEKLKKGAEILGGWEQYYNEEREIASSCEFAVVAYMMWNKEADIERLQKSRESFRNSNREICLYLCSFWEKFSRRRMALYEMEDFQGIADMDRDIEISDIYIDELSGLYRRLMDGETEELQVNTMQVYSDVGAFMKAAALMDRVSRLRALSGKESRPIMVGSAEEEEGEPEPVRLTEEQIRIYMENFVGREDTYVIQDVDKHGRPGYIQVMEPLTEEVLQEHFCGRRTVGTYVQRSNGTAKFMVIDIDISKKILLETGNNDDMLQPYMQKAANQVQRLLEELRKLGLCGWTEESGYRGYHVWILFTEWVSVRYLNMLQDILEERMGKIPGEVTLEFFPNKSRLKPGKMGQAIKLPYGYHGKTGRQSRLLDEKFRPLSNPGEFIAGMGKYTDFALKRILNTTASSKSATVRESRVDEDISAFGSLSNTIGLVLKRCNLMRYLCQKARTTGYLSHFERMSVLYVFGHLPLSCSPCDSGWGGIGRQYYSAHKPHIVQRKGEHGLRRAEYQQAGTGDNWKDTGTEKTEAGAR